MTYSPPSSAAAITGLSREGAAAAFDPHDAPAAWLADNARLAILFPPGLVVSASPAMLALFDARDREALETRLARGEGPSARRLRHLASTLPIGEPRLEQMRLTIDQRRPAGVNLRFIRIVAPGGASWLLASAPALGAANGAPPAAGNREGSEAEALRTEDDSAFRELGEALTPNSRFLWTLDGEGRFGVSHPALVAAVGANAPRRGESVEAFVRRAELGGGEALARALGERRTFSGLSVEWPLPEPGRRRRVALSAAPLFGRHRELLGYRGFGVLGREFEAAAAPEADFSPAPPEGDRPAETEGFEPGRAPLADAFEMQPEPLAAGLIESDLERAPMGVSEARTPPEISPDADGEPSVAPLSQAFEPEAAPRPDEVAAESEGAAEPIEPDLEPAPMDLSEAGGTPQSFLDADRDRASVTSEVQPPPERTAEIYVLRHPAPMPSSNIVPIRPGALDSLAREMALSFPAESVELSRSERDAFREIARALVGRAPASREDRPDERAGAVDAAEPKRAWAGDPGADGVQVQRNAGAIVDRLPVGVLIARDGQALYANRMLLDLVGYRDFAEFQAANALSGMFRDRDPQAMRAEDAGAVAIVRANGEILSVDGHAQVIAWDGAPATLIALRRSLEAELRARLRAADDEAPTRSGAAGDLQAMLDRATDGAVTLDSAGRILSLNEPAERLFGYHQNEIAGESLLMLLSPQSHPETMTRLESLSQGGEAEAAFRPLQVVGRDRDGASIPLALTLARIGPSEAPQFCALARDLSRELEAERRLNAARESAEAASAAKTGFLAQVSHEIRTPLNAILGFADVMLEERFGPIGNERYKDYIKDIHASGAHVMSLADDLLDLSKIEAGKLELAFESVDANSVIRECVSLMQPQAARERVIMRVSLHDRLPRVMVDERSLKQIMLNLMSNAVKFNEPGGQVIVSTAIDAAGQAVIRVRDTGVGMNESEVGLALTPFSQVAKDGAKGGAGLGLPLTKALVEANKAEFSIKSRREQGTLIEIAFPNIQAAQ
ncbi:MAG TPA: ATP-binding protein [Roseiarcus sp.]